jgi:regulatory protein
MSDDAGAGPEPRRERKPPRQVTAAYLQRAAMAYLERYSSSRENLRRVLRRKVDNRCRLRGEDPAPFAPLIDDVVEKSLRIGLIDDTRYAEARVASLRRRGGSARAIQAKLAAKGLDRETVAAALQAEQGNEEAAAFAYARRRRLGPFRVKDRNTFRERDMAALARAGFGFDLVRRVMSGEAEPD